ncbi:MAG: sulfatase, partial [Chloroflexota bacterium]|nr:sulfatase [Chloroflexota bacterium]
MRYPNILYLHSHDTGRYVRPYGYAIPTPHLQRLAEEGILFRQAFCAAPSCSPSRASLLTGQSAHSSGMVGLAHRGFSLYDYRQHIIHTLRKVGYHSTLIGMQHIAHEPDIIGYDHIAEGSGEQAEEVARAAVAFLSSEPEQPFFLSVGFTETHRDFPSGPTEDPRFCQPPVPLPDTPETREDMAGFKASARQLDEGIGAVLAALDESGMADNTLLFCTTDHGLAFPGMKGNLTDHGIGVMLIMRGPGLFRGGRVYDTLVSHIDLFPTFCDLLDIAYPAWLEGHSMMPLLSGERSQINEEIFAELSYHAAYEPQRAVRTERYKYIRRFGERSGPVLANCDDSPSKMLWMQHGWQNRTIPQEQLYDLIFDPNEANNLAEEPAMRSVLKEMRTRLEGWMRATDDPLLQGPVPAPSGAELNDPE